MKHLPLIQLLAVVLLATPQARAAIVIDSVVVGNPGNAGEAQTQGTFGAVGYAYRIGTFEVTNNQYAAFLNAVADADTFGLYNTNMGTNARGGITQSGVSGSFTYAAKADMGNKPVNLVSWYDAARFANWLHNGQPNGAQGNGTTETGAYTLLGGTTTPSNGLTVTRNAGAQWVLPNENEWYKAAYHKNDGVTGNYFDYPTSSDSVPTAAGAINTAGPTRGDISNPGANVANYGLGADWNGQDGNVVTVGSANDPSTTMVKESASPYGTFDQGGNVTEWNETIVATFSRGARGGSWLQSSAILLASVRQVGSPDAEGVDLGFRVATAIPEPSAALFLTLAVALALAGQTFRRLR